MQQAWSVSHKVSIRVTRFCHLNNQINLGPPPRNQPISSNPLRPGSLAVASYTPSLFTRLVSQVCHWKDTAHASCLTIAICCFLVDRVLHLDVIGPSMLRTQSWCPEGPRIPRFVTTQFHAEPSNIDIVTERYKVISMRPYTELLLQMSVNARRRSALWNAFDRPGSQTPQRSCGGALYPRFWVGKARRRRCGGNVVSK